MAPMTPKDLKLKILGFLGSTREGRMCDRVATLVKNFYAKQKEGHTLEIIGKWISFVKMLSEFLEESTKMVGLGLHSDQAQGPRSRWTGLATPPPILCLIIELTSYLCFSHRSGCSLPFKVLLNLFSSNIGTKSLLANKT